MGYTHYIDTTRPFTDLEWEAFTKEVKSLLKASDIPVGNGSGDEGTSPEFTDDRIAFNGIGDDSHETAMITKDYVGFDFCKTNCKPYDSLVVEFYKLARKYTGARLSSDGGHEVFDVS